MNNLKSFRTSFLRFCIYLESNENHHDKKKYSTYGHISSYNSETFKIKFLYCYELFISIAVLIVDIFVFSSFVYTIDTPDHLKTLPRSLYHDLKDRRFTFGCLPFVIKDTRKVYYISLFLCKR